MRVFAFLALLLLAATCANAIGVFRAAQHVPFKDQLANAAEDNGEALYLTKMFREQGAEATREAAKVTGLKGAEDVPSYSGYFTVREETQNNMFFWYFPAQNGDADAPLVIWLQVRVRSRVYCAERQ